MRDYSGGAGTLSQRALSEKQCRRHLKIAQGQGNRLLIFLHFNDWVLGVAPWGINSLLLACPVFKPNTLQEPKNTLGQSDAGSPQSPRNFHAGDPQGGQGNMVRDWQQVRQQWEAGWWQTWFESVSLLLTVWFKHVCQGHWTSLFYKMRFLMLISQGVIRVPYNDVTLYVNSHHKTQHTASAQ